MKKIWLLAFFLLFLFFPTPLFAWLDCPFGKVNDPFPGSCSRFLDTNQNQICDHSEPAPTIETLSQKNTLSQPKVAVGFLFLRSPFFWLSLFILFLYLLHWILVFKSSLPKKIPWLVPLTFRFFWNFILLVTFLLTAVSALFILFGQTSSFLLSTHNLTGLAFVLVAFFHFWQHLSYFLVFFRRKKGE